jgi:exosortase/archaeosortase family protein
MTFLVRFALGWICALLLVSFVPGIERWAIRGTLHSLGWLAGLFTPSVEVAEPAFTLGGTRVNIVPDCTPLMPTTALWMAILAFPSSGRWKLVGALAGAAVLWLYNLGRILATVAVLKMRPEWFDFVHVYLWQTLTVVVLFALFVLWMRFEPRRRVAS